MKMNDKHIFAIFLVLAVGLFLIVYFVPLTNTNEEISSLESNNNSLRKEISELQVYHDNKAQYESDIETLKNEVVDIVSKYPSEYKEEDYVLEGIAMRDAGDTLQYSAISIADPESLALITEDTIKSAEIEGYDKKIEYLYQKVDYSMEINYSSLKDVIAEAFSSDYKLNVDSITFTREKDENILKGVVSLGFYYVDGNGREYEEPVIEEYTSGTDNIFIGGYGADLYQKIEKAIKDAFIDALTNPETNEEDAEAENE